ncbi:MAG: hypothetical protein ACXV9P_14655 [Acidimicrobiia bacterium]
MLSIGTAVEVRERFCGRWSGGFQVFGATQDAYAVQRTSDQSVLPVLFAVHEIRRAG